MLLPCRYSAITMSSPSYLTRKCHAPSRTFVVFHGDRSSRYRHRGEGGGEDRHRAWNRNSSSSPRRHHHYRQDRGLVAVKLSRPYDGIIAMARTNQSVGGVRHHDDAFDVTRRWRSDGDVDLRGGETKNDDVTKTTTSVKIGDRRREDHAHCVEIVRTRDYEGYRECDED